MIMAPAAQPRPVTGTSHDESQSAMSMPPPSAARGAAITIDGIAKRYGGVVAVDQVSLDIAAGEFVSLLGPSGSGKTTLLMMIAGFETPDAGAIRVGGRDITAVAPNRRGIGMVFQRYALFPHMTVARNIAYPLRMRGVPRGEIQRRVEEALALVRLEGYGARLPNQLSGGQQQRVAVARALVFEPPALLMDEPLGALDKKLREQMQIEIKRLQRALGVTVIYVTHDQEEALTMSDRVAVMDGGRLVQAGTPVELYEAPATAFVADFIGKMNFLAGRCRVATAERVAIELAEGVVIEMPVSRVRGTAHPGAALQVAVRPEQLTLARAGEAALPGPTLPGILETAIFVGAFQVCLVRTAGDVVLHVQVPPGLSPRDGARVHVAFDPASLHVFAES
jgi:spermidine/putrescine ABC transporter ATP-binding subunit